MRTLTCSHEAAVGLSVSNAPLPPSSRDTHSLLLHALLCLSETQPFAPAACIALRALLIRTQAVSVPIWQCGVAAVCAGPPIQGELYTCMALLIDYLSGQFRILGLLLAQSSALLLVDLRFVTTASAGMEPLRRSRFPPQPTQPASPDSLPAPVLKADMHGGDMPISHCCAC